MIATSMGAALPYSDYANTFADWVRQAKRLLDRADPARIPLALVEHTARPDTEGLRAQIYAAARKHPFDLEVLSFGGLAFNHLGEAQTSLEFSDRAYRLVRDSPSAYGPLIVSSRARIMLGQDEKALELAQQALRAKTKFPACHAIAASALAHLDRLDEARAEIDVIRRLAPGMTVTSIMRGNGYVDNAATRRYFDGLRLAGLPEGDA